MTDTRRVPLDAMHRAAGAKMPGAGPPDPEVFGIQPHTALPKRFDFR